MTFFFIAVVSACSWRINMLPGLAIFHSHSSYNAAFTLHGNHHDFPCRNPGRAHHFRELFSSILIGGRDMIFPRLNLLPGTVIHRRVARHGLDIFRAAGRLTTGWTFYVPFSLKTTVNVPLAVYCGFHSRYVVDPHGSHLVTTDAPARAREWGFSKCRFRYGDFTPRRGCRFATPIIASHASRGHGAALRHRRFRSVKRRRPAFISAPVLDSIRTRRCTS